MYRCQFYSLSGLPCPSYGLAVIAGPKIRSRAWLRLGQSVGSHRERFRFLGRAFSREHVDSVVDRPDVELQSVDLPLSRIDPVGEVHDKLFETRYALLD